MEINLQTYLYRKSKKCLEVVPAKGQLHPRPRQIYSRTIYGKIRHTPMRPESFTPAAGAKHSRRPASPKTGTHVSLGTNITTPVPRHVEDEDEQRRKRKRKRETTNKADELKADHTHTAVMDHSGKRNLRRSGPISIEVLDW